MIIIIGVLKSWYMNFVCSPVITGRYDQPIKVQN